MFDQPKIIEGNLNIYYKRQRDIRKDPGRIEDLISNVLPNYFTLPIVMPIPDEFDPYIPRIAFNSTGGDLQLLISQINLTLIVSFPPEIQTNFEICKNRLKDLTLKLYDTGKEIFRTDPLFVGVFIRIDIGAGSEDNSLITDFLSNLCFSEKFKKSLINLYQVHDLEIKTTKIVDNSFFCNITIRNFRDWRLPLSLPEVPRLSERDVTNRGIQILIDFNDRYAFNENINYFTNKEVLDSIINQIFNEVYYTSNAILG